MPLGLSLPRAAAGCGSLRWRRFPSLRRSLVPRRSAAAGTPGAFGAVGARSERRRADQRASGFRSSYPGRSASAPALFGSASPSLRADGGRRLFFLRSARRSRASPRRSPRFTPSGVTPITAGGEACSGARGRCQGRRWSPRWMQSAPAARTSLNPRWRRGRRRGARRALGSRRLRGPRGHGRHRRLRRQSDGRPAPWGNRPARASRYAFGLTLGRDQPAGGDAAQARSSPLLRARTSTTSSYWCAKAGKPRSSFIEEGRRSRSPPIVDLGRGRGTGCRESRSRAGAHPEPGGLHER